MSTKKYTRPWKKSHKRSNFTLSLEVCEKLRTMADQEKVSMTSLIERLINQYWENKKPPA